MPTPPPEIPECNDTGTESRSSYAYRNRSRWYNWGLENRMSKEEVDAVMPEQFKKRSRGAPKKQYEPIPEPPRPVQQNGVNGDDIYALMDKEERETEEFLRMDEEGYSTEDVIEPPKPKIKNKEIEPLIDVGDMTVKHEETGVNWPLPSCLLGDPAADYWRYACSIVPENAGKVSLGNVITLARFSYEIAKFSQDPPPSVKPKEWATLKMQAIRSLDSTLNEIKKISLQYGQTDLSAKILKEIYGFVDPRRSKDV